MIAINSEPGGKEETRPVKTFMGFFTIAQDYNGVFMMLLYNPPLPTHHTTKETNRVLMFNELNTLIPPAVTKLSQLRAV